MVRFRCVMCCLTASILISLAWFTDMVTSHPTADAADALIQQLGHPQFETRTKAATQLEQMGSTALPALRKALKNPDPEIARRAEDLIRSIEKNSELNQLLQPTMVQLNYENATFEKVVNDLATQTHFNLQVSDEALKEKVIRIKTGKVPFWEAADQLCTLAACQIRALPNATPRKPENDPFAPRPGMPPNFPRIQLPNMQGLNDARNANASPTTLVFEPSKLKPIQHAIHGALSIRALPIQSAENERIREYTALLLEVRPEPTLQWNGAIDVRCEPIKDDLNLPVEVTNTELSNRHSVNVDKSTNQSILPWNQQLVLLLRPSEKPGTKIPSLKGVLILPVIPAERPLITIDDLMNVQKPTTHRASTGEQLTVVSIDVKSNGELTLVVEQQSEMSNQQAGNQIIVMQGNFQVQGNIQVQIGGKGPRGRVLHQSNIHPIAGLQLFDEQGKPYAGMTRSESMKIANNQQTRTLTIDYVPPHEKAKPTRLQWLSSRPTTVELPFELKELPMPK